ncbi:MAG: hypothetical protein IJO60_03360 [Agathobacter sp.]|nr:hypothetical protein [Agathobacter sp.]
MIEFVNDKERNLKNLKQIGTPKEENKIYVEDMVYAKIKETSYKEKRVFVLMGHTERLEGRYVTFIEGVIPIREIDFQGNTPRWNNSTWSEIFREIKRLYEDMIIVGWAVDIKGMLPKVTLELERVHREHFGGVHQLLFLLDTLEQEETFYIYKENKVVPKDGFYIYHKARKKEVVDFTEEKREPIPIKVLEQKQEYLSQKRTQVDVEVDIQQEEEETKNWKGGRYRQLMLTNEKKPHKSADDGNLGIAIAVAMLIFVIGVGVYEDRDNLFGPSNSVPTNVMQEQNQSDTQVMMELDEEDVNVNGEEETDVSADAEVIPMDVISGTEQTDEEK